MASAKTEKVSAVTNGPAPFHSRMSSADHSIIAPSIRSAPIGTRHMARRASGGSAKPRSGSAAGSGSSAISRSAKKIVATANGGCRRICWVRKPISRCAKAPPMSAPATVPKLQKAWQRVMIRRLSTRSVWLALAFIDTSMVAMVSPQRKRARPSVTASGASPGTMKLRRNPAPPTVTVTRSPRRRITRPTRRKPSIVPTGMPKRQKASVRISSPSAAFTSGMRGNQTERPTAFSAKTICSGRMRGGAADIGGDLGRLGPLSPADPAGPAVRRREHADASRARSAQPATAELNSPGPK